MYPIPACSNWSYFYISSRRGVDLFINKMCSKFWHEFDVHAIVPRIDSRLFSFFCNCVTHAVFTYKKKLKDTSSNEKKCSY